jgi:acyl carrier protein
MLDTEKVEKLIFDILHTMNEEMPDDRQIVISSDSVLFGENPQIDSLSLVSLVVDLETTLNSDYNLDISLTDDRAMTRTVSPFQTVKTLRDYIVELISEN